MGRSNSCFKIITCGSDSTDRDDLAAPENKGSTDKRRWSFRKKSAHHRVLSNTITSETTPFVDKEKSESTNLSFQPPDIPPALEKIAMIRCTDEKPQLSEKQQLSTSRDEEVPETIVATKNENEVDGHVEEAVVIVIQAAVRGHLARKELLKLKNVVKLQAAVRGHLVRQHATGTLRCVHAIVKMQALVRARRARLSQEGSYIEKEENRKLDEPISNTLRKENSVIKPIEKVITNSFARQLLESTPKTKPIRIKCDSSKPNSAWNWLERWMSASSAEPMSKPEVRAEPLEIEKNETFSSPVETRVPPDRFSELEDLKTNTKEIVLAPESEENLIKSDAADFEFQVSHGNPSLVGDNLEQPPAETTAEFGAEEISVTINSIQNQPPTETTAKSDAEETSITINPIQNQTLQSEVNSEKMTDSLVYKQEIESEQPDQPKRSMKRGASELLETEGTKFVYGSRKASNPAFIAAQSKFDGLSSTASLNRSFSSSHQESGIESHKDTSGICNESRTKELVMTENPVSHNSRVQYGGSECGTELSVTSTLDSPDVFEVGAAEFEHEAKVSAEKTCNPNRMKDLDVEEEDSSKDPISNSYMDKPEKPDDAKSESVTAVVDEDSTEEELKPERGVSDIQRDLNSETVGLAGSSPAASPRSHVTVPESQGTPSSQLSVKAKNNKNDRISSSKKRKSSSTVKKSPSSSIHDSGARSSVESKDQKNGKRCSSFGSTKTDQTDQEPRDSSISCSLPHFMQATESARAKVNTNSSPRSSPDVQDRDFIKKRHSLPGANGRQISPRIQRSMSQAQQGAKADGSHIVHEKNWQR